MCSQRHELAHINPLAFMRTGVGIDWRREERESEKGRGAGVEGVGCKEGGRGWGRSGGSTLAHEFHPFPPKIKRPDKCWG